MKTEKFNTSSELEKILRKMSGDETLFAIYEKKDKELAVFATSDNRKDIVCAIAAILETSLTGKGDECMDAVTHIIIDALKRVQKSKSVAGLKLVTEMLKGIVEKSEIRDDDNEDCTDCELMRVCDEKQAVEYRKAHKIPRPKKGKGRKIDVK